MWGVNRAGGEAVDTVLLWFARIVLRVKATASNIITLGECGLVPPSVTCAINVILYFTRIREFPDSSIIKSLFIEQKRFHDLGFTNWYGKVWELAESYGIKLDRSYDKIAVKDIITRSFRIKWLTEKSNLEKNTILRTYDKIKQNFIMEPYLYLVKKTKYRIALSKLRCSSHTLAIEKGRHIKPRTNISDRLCLYCSNNTIEDEKHFVVQCPFYSEERKQLFKKVHSINPSFVHMSDDEKFVYLFCSNDERILAWFGKFIHISLPKRVVL